MDNDTKVTYLVIILLIVGLGSIAFFLQGNTDDTTPNKDNQKEQITTQKQLKPITQQSQQVAAATNATTTSTIMPPEKITSATITTNKGVIEVEFSQTTPNTVKNFATLAQSKFYEGVRFHRVIKDFMIQAGDPLSKDLSQKAIWGTGGPGYKFADELTGNEKYPLGTLAMANAGPNTNGSQFFIVTANPGVPLPANYTVFGHVTSGIEVANAIQNVKTDGTDKPLEDIIIEKVEIR